MPTGDYSGVTINTWLFYLHMASIWGLPYKTISLLHGFGDYHAVCDGHLHLV